MRKEMLKEMLKIDFEKRLSFDDHIRLFFYDCLKNGKWCDYDAWHIRESLIADYNAETDKAMAAAIDKCIADNSKLVEGLRQRAVWDFEKPVIWNDRYKSHYYIKNLEDSHRFEVYAEHVFKSYGLDIGLFYGKSQQYYIGETKVGIEIKCDKRSEKTGNYYIEYQERLNDYGEWVNSGILKEDNTKYYFYGVVNNYAIFRRDDLMEYYEKIVIQRNPPVACRMVQIRTSKGFIIPKTEAEKIRLNPSTVVMEIKNRIAKI